MAAERGDEVTVEYTGKLEDGTIFDSSEEREPLTFTLGDEQVIPGFEEAVLGMEPGESTTANVPPEDGYGARTDERVFEVERTDLPEEIDPEVGDRLQVQDRAGQTFPASVVEVADSTVTLDANHPLAGQELTFDIELVSVG